MASWTSLTLKDAADELGVHYMTAYRYVRLGLLPARKEGSVWQIERSDLDRLAAGRPKPSKAPVRADWARRLTSRLIAGDEAGAWQIVEAAMTSGKDAAHIHLEVLSPAMRSIGSAWARGRLDIADEHRATAIAQRIIGRLGPHFARRGRSRGTVVIGTPAGELHALPTAMVADLLRGAGFAVLDLGSDLPPESFVVAAQDATRLVAAAVSVTSPGSLRPAKKLIALLHESLDDVPVLVGGNAVTSPEQAQSLGADGWAADAAGAVAAVESLLSPTPS